MKDRRVQTRLREARVARLATGDPQGRPHLVPVCFAYDGRAFYTAIDLKPKRKQSQGLVRVRHIRENPNVALLIDEYREAWNDLWYILVRGKAETLTDGPEHEEALRLLKFKYPQYSSGGFLPEKAQVIRVMPETIYPWGKV